MLVMAVWFFGNLQAPKDKDFAFTEFGRLPVTANGRIVADGFARAQFAAGNPRETNAQHRAVERTGTKIRKIIPATEWLANVMMNPTVADDWPVFRVDNPDLISLLKLPDKGAANKTDGKHYSWNQIAPSLDTFDKENKRVENIEPASRTAYENAVAKMQQRLSLYAQLKNTVQPADAQDWPAELAAYEKIIPDGVAAVKAQQAGQKYDQTNFNTFVGFIERFQFMASLEPPLILPPNGASEWRRMGDALLEVPRGTPRGRRPSATMRTWPARSPRTSRTNLMPR